MTIRIRATSSHLATLVLALLAASALAQTVVPITGEPDHHLVISNEYVRVFQVEVPPKAETLYHRHDYDYLYVAIGDADVTSTRLHDKPLRVLLKDGEVELAKGPFAHKAGNNRSQLFRNVTVELLHGIGTPTCGLIGGDKSCGVGPGDAGGNGSTGFTMASVPLLRSSNLAVDRITLKGHADAELSLWSRGPSLLVPISDINLRGSSQNSTLAISRQAGSPVWIPEPNTKLANLSQSSEFVLISFSPAPVQ